MLFNSVQFVLFLPVVFTIYWLLGKKNIRLQNAFLLVASYYFYGSWDWRFLILIFISSLGDYLIGLVLEKSEKKTHRQLLMAASLVINLGILGFFKYYNFFVDSFVEFFSVFNVELNVTTLKIILPVGISFYTFQTLSYTIDIYKRKFKPIKDPIAFFAFVSFFPQLVAGPIERASNLLPQFQQQRNFDSKKAADGLRQILWGLFKKLVIADNMAGFVSFAVANHEAASAFDLFIGALCFSFQVYCDFSGYSDIAIGTARLFGFDLMRNFGYPFFSRNWRELWTRWHISLTTWFRDYVFVPLGGSRRGKGKTIVNSVITFLVSGFWHGANWNFVIWGFLSGILFIPFLLLRAKKKHPVVAKGKMLPSIPEFIQMGYTFLLFSLVNVLFFTNSVKISLVYYKRLFTLQKGSVDAPSIKLYLLIALLFLGVEWIQRTKKHGLEVDHWNMYLRWFAYITIVCMIFVFGKLSGVHFIYFQF